MNIVAIMASYRKGRTIDTLVDRAIAGTLAVLNHFAAACATEGCGESDR